MPNHMMILKVISRLMDYPTKELFDAVDEMIEVVNNSEELSLQKRTTMIEFITTLTARDLYDAQESYGLLFDRGRALSLLLFEHVHGESRDRGQAMVELMNVYNSKGVYVDVSQLPDYIPLYLEFLSEQDTAYAQEWLGDICHLLTTLAERLIDRQCAYSILFDSLIEISGYAVDRQEIAKAVRKEERDDTVEAIDKEWEEKEVKFDDPTMDACPGMESNKEVPVAWHDAKSTNKTSTNINQQIGS